jgi:hypothetical protein
VRHSVSTIILHCTMYEYSFDPRGL